MGFKKTNVYQMVFSPSSAMASTNTITSNIQNILNFDNHGLQIKWTGTPTGTLTFNVSNDGVNFDSLTFVPALAQPAGSGSHYAVSLNQVPFQFLQISYTNVSGTGVLTASICSGDLN